MFIVHYPRRVGKSRNSAAYAETVLAAVRDWVHTAHRRRPGHPSGDSRFLSLVLRGLRKASPIMPRLPREPILQIHLRAIRPLLDLRTNQLHRVLWAFYLCCWQGVRRCGDLIRPKRNPRSVVAWDPSRDTHRGRVKVVPAYASDGSLCGRSVELCLKPTKTDLEGSVRFSVYYPYDPHPGSLSAAVALNEMLKGDMVEGDLHFIPLFRDPTTGTELTYDTASRHLRRLLEEAGYPDLARG